MLILIGFYQLIKQKTSSLKYMMMARAMFIVIVL